MDLLDGFVSFNFGEGVPYVSVTNNGITFNKAVVMKLGRPGYVELLIDEENKRIALLPCDADKKNAVPFYKPKKSKVLSIRWNSRDLINTITRMMHWDLQKITYRIEGNLFKDENVMIFNLIEAREIF